MDAINDPAQIQANALEVRAARLAAKRAGKDPMKAAMKVIAEQDRRMAAAAG